MDQTGQTRKQPDEELETTFGNAMTELLAGRTAESLESLGRCLALDPRFAPAWSVRAGIHVREGRHEEAERDIEQALTLRPDHPGDLHNRAVVRTALGRYDQAIRDYEAVLRRDPESGGTWSNLAWVLATAPDPRVRDGKRAVRCARRALRQARTPAWLDTLAAALAETGDFERAIAVQEEACDASDLTNTRFHRRLDGYRHGRTVVEGRRE
ncbi:MAG: tetratricopeptide repeat protein [Planctomycetota bacterium]